MKKYYNPITILVLVFFTFFSLRLDLFAEVIAQPNQPLSQNTNPTKSPTPARQFQNLLQDTEELLGKMEIGGDISFGLNQLKANKTDLIRLGVELRLEFSQTKTNLLSQNASSEILQRHDEFVKDFEEKIFTLLNNLEEVEKAKDIEVQGKVKKVRENLKANLPKPQHTPLDPKKLPHRSSNLRSKVSQVDIFSKLFGVSIAYAEEIDPIKTKAAELEYNPIKTYEWVRNNIEYLPYYGSIQSPYMTLETLKGNGFDQASLLMALLKASNISARYVYGVVEIPIEKAMNWVGGVQEEYLAPLILQSCGIPTTTVVSGGKISAIKIEHCWVEAYLQYTPFRGIPTQISGEKIWLPLDPSFKQYDFVEGIDISSQVPFTPEEYLQQQRTGSSLDYYEDKIKEYLTTNMPDKDITDLLETKLIKPQEFGILLSSLPYKILTKLNTYSELPDNLKWKVQFTIPTEESGSNLDYTISLSQLGISRLTLSYIPATTEDENLVNQYGGLYNVPAYLIRVKPVIKVDGVVAVEGLPIGMGETQSLNVYFISPQTTDLIQTNLITGTYTGIGITPGWINENLLIPRSFVLKEKWEQAIIQGKQAGIFQDDLEGELFWLISSDYFATTGLNDEVIGSLLHVIPIPGVDCALSYGKLEVETLFGVPYQVTLSGMMLDALRYSISSFNKTTAEEWKKKSYMLLSGYTGSGWEHIVWRLEYQSEKGISTVKALQVAKETGVPIYDIDSGNIEEILPQVQVTEEVKEDIRNSINVGKTVKISGMNITWNGWSGIGYIVVDPITGEGAYRISGGVAGGWYPYPPKTPQDKASLLVLGPPVVVPTFERVDGLNKFRISNAARHLYTMGYKIFSVWDLENNEKFFNLLNGKIEGLSFIIPFKIFYILCHGGLNYSLKVSKSEAIADSEINSNLAQNMMYKFVLISACGEPAIDDTPTKFYTAFHNPEALIGPTTEIVVPKGSYMPISLLKFISEDRNRKISDYTHTDTWIKYYQDYFELIGDTNLWE